MNAQSPKNASSIRGLSEIDRTKLPPDGGPRFNRLIFEKSPYLLQHAENPLAWYPWGEEAFTRANKEDKPVFLSIGYSTCHWCHVMAHESFEDNEVATVINNDFVSIKVDREERPDIDNTYMTVCQMLTGSGGWPLTLFLTPDKKPFFAATYLPKHSRRGMMGLVELAKRISHMWHDERDRLLGAGDQIHQSLLHLEQPPEGDRELDESVFALAREHFLTSFDRTHAGFGSAPKFPTPHNLSLLLRIARRANDQKARVMALQTLQQMRMGGIFDQIGFGLHRYSVDEKWLVPHFEKMLYDQALAALAYLDGWQTTGDTFFAQTAREIFNYVIRDLKHGEGGFYCGEDADSEGAEGTFYIWDPEEIKSIVGEKEGAIFCRVFGVTEEGNFEGKNILHMGKDIGEIANAAGIHADELGDLLGRCRHQLFQARSDRPRPHLDDKILTGWNGLMIAALARSGTMLEEGVYLAEAAQAADFILSRMRREDGRLLRRFRDGEAAIPGFLEDYSFFVYGLTELFFASCEPRFLVAARDLTLQMITLFGDEGRGFFDTGSDVETVLTRGRNIHDGAVPAGTSLTALNLLRLGRILDDPELEEKGEQLIKQLLPQVRKNPHAFSQLLIALDFALSPREELVITLPEEMAWPEEMMSVLNRTYRPNMLVLVRRDSAPDLEKIAPVTREKAPIDGRPTAYLCRDRNCRRPATSAQELAELLAG